jgi:hypothetical protein
MRLTVLMFIALVVMSITGVAYAASSYDDVPRDHWAYNALDYLTERGVLEGYPDGFFKGDRTLTRYEFAQAIARLLDTIEQGVGDEQIQIMANTLRAEFSDQLAQINGKLDGLGNSVQDLDMRVSDLEGMTAENAEKIAGLEDKVSGLKPGPEWKGSFRYRWQFDEQGDNERFRQRIQFILGYNKQVNDAVMVGFRFKTETGLTANDGNFTLGSKDGRTADIFLDQAYVKYSPSWFGFYEDCGDDCMHCDDCDECPECQSCIPKLDIYAGIFPNITQDMNEMVLDSDVNFQGVGLVYHFNDDFQILTSASVFVEENGGDFFDDDTYLYACEIKHDNILIDCLDAWVGCYTWDNEGNLPSNYFDHNRLNNFDFNNDLGVNGDDRFSPDFHILKAGLQYTFGCVWDRPFSVYGEYMINTASDAEDRIAAVNPFIDPDIIYETSDDTGFVVGAQLGNTPKYCGDWYAFARYKEIGANATIHGLADSDTGGANRNALEVHWGYLWADNSLLGITYITSKMHNAFGFQVPAAQDDMNTLQVDWTFKF